MRWLLAGLMFVLIGLSPAAVPAAPQEQPGAEQSNGYFSGIVAEMAAGRLTVSRTVLGKNSESRTFLLTSATRVEGKLHVKARVTVQFVTKEEGDHAVHIIVRDRSQR